MIQKNFLLLFFSLLPVFSTADPTKSIKQGPIPIDPNTHGIGRWIPNLSFITINGIKGELSDFGNKKSLVIAFIGASCPISKKFAPSLATLEKEYAAKDVAFLFIDPIATASASKNLQKMVHVHGFTSPVILDRTKEFALALGAKSTTEAFVLDSARTLLYRGPVNDQYGLGYQLAYPRRHHLKDALNSVLRSKPVGEKAFWSPGCELSLKEKKNPELEWTYHNRISRILKNNCVECHREGGVGPFPLEHYDEAKENAGMIRKVVSEGIMPPWFAADPKPGHLSLWANDRSLSSSDKRDLLAWIQNGKPEGNPADAPLPRERRSEWDIGKPDEIFSIPREVIVRATGVMPYVNLRLKTNFAKDRWIEAAEVRPTAPEAVHHVLVFIEDENGISQKGPGALAAYVPGNTYVKFPEGVAKKLPAGATLFFQLHYNPTGKATKDRTRIGLRYAKNIPKKVVRTIPVVNRRIKIPPNQGNHVEIAYGKFPTGTVVRAFMPHMHLRGKSIKYELLTQNGERETLLDVPHFDFNWQLRYELRQPLRLPDDSRIQVTGVFDNSKDNPANPNPNVTVRWGDQSEDEMLIGYLECEYDFVNTTFQIGEKENHLFNRLDRNRDGFLTQNEFTKPQLFPFFDTNQDGHVTKEEGMEGMAKLKERKQKSYKSSSDWRGWLDRFF